MSASSLGFGTHVGADARLVSAFRTRAGSSVVEADVLGQRICSYTLGMPGRHIALNSLAVASCDACDGRRSCGRRRRVSSLISCRHRAVACVSA